MLLTAELESLRGRVRAFVQTQINPHVDVWEEVGRMPLATLFRAMAAEQLLGLTHPARFGGSDCDFSHAVAMAEALGEANCGAVQMSIVVQTELATRALATFGSDELREQFLAPCIAGDTIASLGVTERAAGSDVAAIGTVARSEGSDYRIYGEKTWVANGTQAHFMVVLANTSEGSPHRNKSLIVVPLDLPGVTRGEPVPKLGMRAAETPSIVLDGVRVPKRFVIGEVGHGFRYQMLNFQRERLWAAANCIRTLERCVWLTAEYTAARQAFGKPLLDNQTIHFRLAELKAEIEAFRALTYMATADMVAGKDAGERASMAKLLAGRLMRTVPDACLQYWGAEGYRWNNAVARLFRDGRLMSIGGGADEVMLTIIAKYMDILPRGRA